MNLCQQRAIVQTFHDIGFANFSCANLQRLSDHYQQCNKRLMMIISHSASEDFLLGLLLFHFSSIPITMFTNFKSPIYRQMAKSFGMLVHDKSQSISNTKLIIEHLKQRDKFGFLISLGPTRPNEKVHSGYFHIAQTLQIPMVVIGFDYFLKFNFVSEKRWAPSVNETYGHFQQTSERDILDNIQQICPLRINLQPGFNPDHYPHGKLIGVTPQCPSLLVLFRALGRAHLQTSYMLRHTLLMVVFCLGLLLMLLCFLSSLRFQMKTKNKQNSNHGRRK